MHVLVNSVVVSTNGMWYGPLPATVLTCRLDPEEQRLKVQFNSYKKLRLKKKNSLKMHLKISGKWQPFYLGLKMPSVENVYLDLIIT